jgi:hypothetical protein
MKETQNPSCGQILIMVLSFVAVVAMISLYCPRYQPMTEGFVTAKNFHPAGKQQNDLYTGETLVPGSYYYGASWTLTIVRTNGFYVDTANISVGVDTFNRTEIEQYIKFSSAE